MGLIRFLFLGLMLLPVSSLAEEAGGRDITFAIPAAPLTNFQQARLPAGAQNPPGRLLQGRLRTLKGKTRQPAVVLIHTCHGSDVYEPWFRRMQMWGYATLSFSRCQPPDFEPVDNKVPSLDWKEGALAAYGALKFLRSQPQIDPDRIGLIAWSRLGMIPLSVFNLEGAAQFFPERYSAAVALYPFCSFARGPHDGPLLVVSAGRDDWVDPTVCARMARLTEADRVPVQFSLMSEALHGFDIEAFGPPKFAGQAINPDGFAAGGGTLGYDRSAAESAIGQVRDFLAKYLKPRSN